MIFSFIQKSSGMSGYNQSLYQKTSVWDCLEFMEGKMDSDPLISLTDI